MKTIILYATKYGAAAEIAQRISSQLEGSSVYDLKQEGIPDLTEFDCVIIGSSVYAGMLRKEAKSFILQNAGDLCEKKPGLFISGMSEGDGAGIFKANIPGEVLEATKVSCILGGVFDPKKANFFERLIMKAVSKQSDYMSTISDEKISEFVEAVKAADSI